MLSIGEFSGLTGSSVKALRHYDEKGLLTPAEVDEHSGYRRYAEDQVRAGAVIRALRDAGVPLSGVTADGTLAPSVLAPHRSAILEQRAREDAAFVDAQAALHALLAPVTVERRKCPAQPFVGRPLSVPADDAGTVSDADANAALGDLLERLPAAGLAPAGQFWTTLRAGTSDRIEIVYCWPVSERLPAEWGGPDTVAGELPERVELIASWRSAPDTSVPERATHPAIVALFDALAEQHLDLRHAEVRQRVIGTDENDYTVEVSITVER